jgi:hypothetical protein
LMIGSHALLLGSFLLYMSYSERFHGKWPWSSRSDPDASSSTDASPSVRASGGPSENHDEPSMFAPGLHSSASRQDFPSELRDRESREAEPSVEPASPSSKPSNPTSREKEPSSSQKKRDRTRKKTSSRGAPPVFPERPIQVKPVFFLPRGGPEPSPERKKILADHLAWCQTRYNEMLSGVDTFTLEKEESYAARRSVLHSLRRALPAPRACRE